METLKSIIIELEEELESIERNWQNGKYKTQEEKDLCELIYNTKKHQIIKDLRIVKFYLGDNNNEKN